MGQARDVVDQLMASVSTTKDLKTIVDLYAEDAVIVSPDKGEIAGREQIAGYIQSWLDSFPDFRVETQHKYEVGNVAIDECYAYGTNTAASTLLSGDRVEATGKRLSLRTCDVITVDNGLITRHHIYYDQAAVNSQLSDSPS